MAEQFVKVAAVPSRHGLVQVDVVDAAEERTLLLAVFIWPEGEDGEVVRFLHAEGWLVSGEWERLSPGLRVAPLERLGW